MARKKGTITKYEIIQVACEFFLTKGVSNTSPKMIAEELDMSTGNITYYFPSKEHLLEVLMEMLCDFQWKILETEADRGIDSVMSLCLELMTVASACEESEIARDFFVTTYQSELCRQYLRKNHVDRAKKIFAEQCSGWTDEQFIEAEVLVMGIQYGTIVAYDSGVSLDMRISGALDLMLSIYNVDAETRKKEIDRVLSMDCRGLGVRVLNEFVKFVETTNDTALVEIVRGRRKKSVK